MADGTRVAPAELLRSLAAGTKDDIGTRAASSRPAARDRARALYWSLKRPIGLALALLITPALLLPMAVIAAVLGYQGRPVLIQRRRLGLNGKQFTSYYFRTMVPHSVRALQRSDLQPVTASSSSDAFGRLLLRTRLDHLPLLFNVLRGDINLVGPRPLAQEELMVAGRAARHTLSVRPGLTGMWWVRGELELERRLALDRNYIEHASPLLDLGIVLTTAALMHGFQSRSAERRA